MDPFRDYIPEPPSLDVIDDQINRLGDSIKAIERLRSQGRITGSDAIEYLGGIRKLWEARRCGEVLDYARRLPEDLQRLELMRDQMEECAAKARREDQEIVNAIASELENGIDAPILLGCNKEHIAMLENRIASIEAAISFLNANL
jgi:hypothetical protein